MTSGLHEGVPPHLHEPLSTWIQRHTSSYTGMLGRITARLQVDGAHLRLQAQRRKFQRSSVRVGSPNTEYVNDGDIVAELFAHQPDAMLHLAHIMLEEGDDGFIHRDGAVGQLRAILDNAHSVWRVADDGLGLLRRVTEPAAQHLTAAAATARPSAAQHLHAAWRHAFALEPDPSRAYSEAIKAVEAAVVPVVSPNNARATLGTVIRDLTQQGSANWRLAIPVPASQDGLAPFLGMLKLVWHGQTDRHGGSGPTQRPTVESARAAVQLAVTLVQWLSTGALVRR